MKVGKDLIQGKNKIRKTDYRDVTYDKNGWANANKFMPVDYDLVTLKLLDNTYIHGWAVHDSWEGLRLKPTDKVIYWKRKPGEL